MRNDDAATLLWTDGSVPVAAGFLDGPVLRVTAAPGADTEAHSRWRAAAVGFGLGMGWQVRFAYVVATAAAMSIAVEALQYALALGRVSSIDDVLLNATGAGLAVLAAIRFMWPHMSNSSPRHASGAERGDGPWSSA